MVLLNYVIVMNYIGTPGQNQVPTTKTKIQIFDIQKNN